MDLLGTQRNAIEQAVAQVSPIAIRVPVGCNALIDLHQMQSIPRNVFIGQRAEHDPRRVTTADGQDEVTTCGDRLMRIRRNDRCRSPGDGFGIRAYFHLHSVLLRGPQGATTGSCQPPGGAMIEAASLGPQLFGSYSWTGGAAASTGSTIRHASST